MSQYQAPSVFLAVTGPALRREGVGRVPIQLNTTPLIVVRRDGTILCANKWPDKVTFIRDEANAEAVFLAPWPGRWRTDIFLLDRAALLESLDGEEEEAA